MTDFFRIIGDPTRVRLLLLLNDSEFCVSSLADELGTTQSAVSHQLNVLRTNKLVKYRRDGKQIYYTSVNQQVQSILEKGLQQIAD